MRRERYLARKRGPPEDKIWLTQFEQSRSSTLNQFRFLVIGQLMLVFFMSQQAFNDSEIVYQYKVPPASISVVLCRFLCEVFLHIKLTGQINQSFALMKYVLNHHWKFESWIDAFLVGFSQMAVLMSIEILNLMLRLTD